MLLSRHEVEKVATIRMNLLKTRLGPFDVLSSIRDAEPVLAAADRALAADYDAALAVLAEVGESPDAAERSAPA